MLTQVISTTMNDKYYNNFVQESYGYGLLFCGTTQVISTTSDTTHCISNSFLMIHPEEYMHVHVPRVYNKRESLTQWRSLRGGRGAPAPPFGFSLH